MLVGDHADEESELGGGSLGIGGNVGVVVKGSYSGDVGDFGAGLVGCNALSCRLLGKPRHRGCAACAGRTFGMIRGNRRSGRSFGIVRGNRRSGRTFGTVRGGGRAGRAALAGPGGRGTGVGTIGRGGCCARTGPAPANMSP